MNVSPSSTQSFPWFQLFKYTVYVLLIYNVFLFLQEESLASEHFFSGGIQISELIEAFAATLDTGTWVVLLLIFELETYVIDDNRIKGAVKLALHGTRAIAYTILVYAFYGYTAKCLGFYEFSAIPLTDLCLLADNAISFMVDLDEFLLLSQDNCNIIAASSQFMELAGTAVVTDTETLRSSLLLAWTDTINAGTWLLILVILEMDVQLQLKGKLEGQILSVSKIIKAILYSTLIAAAAYWGIAGDFLDFWDALLWILAFIFIELNIFEWQAETAAEKRSQAL